MALSNASGLVIFHQNAKILFQSELDIVSKA
jgi:hypothetical protein